MGSADIWAGCLAGALGVFTVPAAAQPLTPPTPAEDTTSAPVTIAAPAAETTTPEASSNPLPVAPSDQGHVTVTLRGASPGVVWSLYAPEGPLELLQPLTRCGERGCILRMKPGRYRLGVEEVDGSGPRGYRPITVVSDMDVTVRAPNAGKRSAGLVVAILGMVAIPTGLSLTTFGAVGDCTEAEIGERCSPSPNLLTAGIVTLLGGIVATPLGWSTFARNRKPKVEPTRSAMPVASQRRFDWGPQRVGSGYGMGTWISF